MLFVVFDFTIILFKRHIVLNKSTSTRLSETQTPIIRLDLLGKIDIPTVNGI